MSAVIQKPAILQNAHPQDMFLKLQPATNTSITSITAVEPNILVKANDGVNKKRTPFRLRSYLENPYYSHRPRNLRGGYMT